MTITSDTSILLAAGGASAQTGGELPGPSNGVYANGHGNAAAPLQPLDASRLKIQRNSSVEKPNFDNLVFGHKFSPHMLTVQWTAAHGWEAPQIVPYGNLSVSPAAPTFQYASGLFEGMKAYRDVKDPSKVRLFRPDMNMARMNRSAKRAALPTFDPEEMIKLLSTLVRLDADYVPAVDGHSLYLRPTLIGVSDTITRSHEA